VGNEQKGDEVDLSRAAWEKSRSSGVNGCVEVAVVDGQVAVRDSKDRHGPALVFNPVEWQAFLDGARDGQFNLPHDTRSTGG
jgi:hypothetical protein